MSAFELGFRDERASVRIVDHDESLCKLPSPLREGAPLAGRLPVAVRATGGSCASSTTPPEHRRGAGPLNRALLEFDGQPAGYAIYRVAQELEGGEWRKTLRVIEAIGIDARATREIWRFLLQIDWMDELDAWLLPLDHALLQIVARREPAAR